jgi:hypothetical protein
MAPFFWVSWSASRSTTAQAQMKCPAAGPLIFTAKRKSCVKREAAGDLLVDRFPSFSHTHRNDSQSYPYRWSLITELCNRRENSWTCKKKNIVSAEHSPASHREPLARRLAAANRPPPPDRLFAAAYRPLARHSATADRRSPPRPTTPLPLTNAHHLGSPLCQGTTSPT